MEDKKDCITTFSEFETKAYLLKTCYTSILNYWHDSSLTVKGDMSDNQFTDAKEIQCLLMLLDIEMQRYFDYIMSSDYNKIKTYC